MVCRTADREGAGDECTDRRGSTPEYAALSARFRGRTADASGACGPWQDGAGRGTTGEPCGVRPAAGPARPDQPAGTAGEGATARAGTCAVGPDDGVPVHVLPRRGPADGQRSGRPPGVRAVRA